MDQSSLPTSPDKSGTIATPNPTNSSANPAKARNKVLREHGTERAGTSPLNAEKRKGTFACAGCGCGGSAEVHRSWYRSWQFAGLHHAAEQYVGGQPDDDIVEFSTNRGER